ncbi:restriction endonuclease subunit S [Salmonella enterica subsp. diarizonae]|uniref:Restriction endonuclease subunit S n=1 Tax=Salmonella diarizonae TaxID=59204 RepID=A0A6C8XQH7_SALDZ|nr:restriction endonuclease subunit S [Salmonella enterica]EBV2371706.1 restriction endonuclease subunit S [Salmonella enterica subsp. enterica serovar Enteritidis]ECC9188581.1 restriction endonuclease subunit S [Salmonella enterica subsp. diarizonae]EGL0766254.1 restriction endonuclease subunit S [Salmonella enterica subsp. enterica]EBE1334396.1 restriction endonuclease subunit S [Salmonella enterica]
MIVKPLIELSKKISSGLTPLRSNPEFWDNGTIPWLKTEQLGEKYIYETNEHISEVALEKTAIRLFPVNSLSIAMYGEGKTRGNLSILKKSMATNQACCNVEIDSDKADYEYVYYFLKTQYDELRQLSSGVRKNLNSNDIKNYPIRLPSSLDEQRKIACVLKVLDDKIALNNRINAELEAMAKTLYDYWFVQFDFPDANGKPYKTSGGKMEYNATLKREVPVGWKIKKISEIALVKAGGDKPSNCVGFRSDEYSIPIFSNGISSEGLYGYTNISVVNKPSITVSARGTIGYSVLRLKPFFPIIRLLVLTPYQDNALKFLEETIKRFSFENSGSVQQQLTVPQISEMSILYPIEKLLNIYTKRIWPLIKKIELIKEQNSELQQLRDWLLPLLMNGQVTIK